MKAARISEVFQALAIMPSPASAAHHDRPARRLRGFVTPVLLALAAGAALATGVWGKDTLSGSAVSLEQARAELESGQALLIDIREPGEHARGVAPGALLLPMRQLESRLDLIPPDPSARVLLICNTQNRSRATLLALHARGLSHVRYVHGGMSEWARRDWPLVPPGG